jgi:hypothetical protein
MSGTSVSPTGRIRELVVDDAPGVAAPSSAAVTEAARQSRTSADGESARRSVRTAVLEGALEGP